MKEVYVEVRKDNEDENDADGSRLELRIGVVEMDFWSPEAKSRCVARIADADADAVSEVQQEKRQEAKGKTKTAAALSRSVLAASPKRVWCVLAIVAPN